MNINVIILSLLFVFTNVSSMQLGSPINQKSPEEIEMVVIRDHTAVDRTPLSENIVSSFLFEPAEFQASWGAACNDIKRLLVQQFLKVAPLMPWVTSRYPLPTIGAMYHGGEVTEGPGFNYNYKTISQAYWSKSGDQVVLDLDIWGQHSCSVFDTVRVRFQDIGDHACFLADARVLSLNKGKATEWFLDDARRSYKQQPLSVRPHQYPIVKVDGARMSISNLQDAFNNNVLEIHLAASLNSPIKCNIHDSKKKVLAYDKDLILVWQLDCFDKKGRLENPIHVHSVGNKVTSAQFNQNGNGINIVYNNDRIELFDLVSQCIMRRNTFTNAKIENCCYTDSGLVVTLGSIKAGTKNEVRTLSIFRHLNNKMRQLKCIKIQDHYRSFLSVNPACTKVIVENPSGYLALFDLGGLHNIIRFFEREITLEQAILLNCIRWAVAGIAKKFDFRRFPHLKSYYDSLPEEVKEAIAGVVILPATH